MVWYWWDMHECNVCHFWSDDITSVTDQLTIDTAQLRTMWGLHVSTIKWGLLTLAQLW